MSTTVAPVGEGQQVIELRQYQPPRPKPPVNQLDQDAFLQLLTAQLRYQNPLDPLDGSEFVAQLATFSSLEGMLRLNANVETMLKLQQLTQGVGLLGWHVTYQDASGQEITGLARELRLDGNTVQLRVNDQFIPISQVKTVAA